LEMYNATHTTVRDTPAGGPGTITATGNVLVGTPIAGAGVFIPGSDVENSAGAQLDIKDLGEFVMSVPGTTFRMGGGDAIRVNVDGGNLRVVNLIVDPSNANMGAPLLTVTTGVVGAWPGLYVQAAATIGGGYKDGFLLSDTYSSGRLLV